MNPNDYEIHLYCIICCSRIGFLDPTPKDDQIVRRISEALEDHVIAAHTSRSPITIEGRR